MIEERSKAEAALASAELAVAKAAAFFKAVRSGDDAATKSEAWRKFQEAEQHLAKLNEAFRSVFDEMLAPLPKNVAEAYARDAVPLPSAVKAKL